MERELKFLLDHVHLPALPNGFHLAQPQTTLHLLDEYLDYRGQINAAGWRLRRRRADGQPLWYTLKSAHADAASGPLRERREIERVPDHGDDLPLEIVAALTEAGLDVPNLFDRLQVYLSLRQERRPAALFMDDDEVAQLSVDEVRAIAPATDRERRWTELEIEFLDSIPAETRERAIDELSAWFADQPGVSVGGEPKVDHAARLLAISI